MIRGLVYFYLVLFPLFFEFKRLCATKMARLVGCQIQEMITDLLTFCLTQMVIMKMKVISLKYISLSIWLNPHQLAMNSNLKCFSRPQKLTYFNMYQDSINGFLYCSEPTLRSKSPNVQYVLKLDEFTCYKSFTCWS